MRNYIVCFFGFLTDRLRNRKQNLLVTEQGWIQKSECFYDKKGDPEVREKILRTDNSTLDILLAARYKLLKMSEHSTLTEASVVSIRPPLPCPRLPKSLNMKQSKTGNYSYAEVEFRPMIITEEGAISGPIQSLSHTEEDHDDSIHSHHENLQWDDDLGLYEDESRRSPIDFDNVAHDTYNFEIKDDHLRETVIGDDEFYDASDDRDAHSSEYIYDAPIDVVTQQIDVSQLYAQVDFSAKKKKNPSKEVSDSLTDKSAMDPQADHDKKSSTAQSRVSGKSRFFVDIPAKRGDLPPPIPKPCKLLLHFFIIFHNIVSASLSLP